VNEKAQARAGELNAMEERLSRWKTKLSLPIWTNENLFQQMFDDLYDGLR